MSDADMYKEYRAQFDSAITARMTAGEVLTYRTLQAGLASMPVWVVGTDREIAAALIAAMAPVRRFLTLAHRLSTRLNIVFVSVDYGVLPLWLAADGLHVTIYEGNGPKLERLRAIEKRFFAGQVAGSRDEIGTFRVIEQSAALDETAPRAGADLIWLGENALDGMENRPEAIQRFLRWTRRAIIASDLGILAAVPARDGGGGRQIDLIQSGAGAAHMKRLTAHPYVLFRPFEIADDAVPPELTAEPPPAALDLSDFAASDIHRLMGLPPIEPSNDPGDAVQFLNRQTGASL